MYLPKPGGSNKLNAKVKKENLRTTDAISLTNAGNRKLGEGEGFLEEKRPRRPQTICSVGLASTLIQTSQLLKAFFFFCETIREACTLIRY